MRDPQTDELIMVDFQEGISSLYLVETSKSEERIWQLGGFPVEIIKLVS